MIQYRCEYCGRTETRSEDMRAPRCLHGRWARRKNRMMQVKTQTYSAVIVPAWLADEIESIFTEENH